MTAFALDGVYPPQEDSQLLIDVLAGGAPLKGRSVVDLGTGSGVVAVAAAQLGARSVTAFDICPTAVRCARGNALAAGVEVHVRLGSWSQALECEPFDVVVCNPPYVPSGAEVDTGSIPPWAGPMTAWDGGEDGRLVLDPLCATVPQMLSDDGALLLVQSEFSDIGKSVTLLREAGLETKIAAVQSIPFGPVLSAHARELEASGRLTAGRRHELLAVIRAEKTMSEFRTVRVVAGGPILVEGPVKIETPDGRVVESSRFMVAICACRRSKNYPLCDTSHRKARRSVERPK